MQDLVKDINQGLNPFQPGAAPDRSVAALESAREFAGGRTLSVHRVYQVFAFWIDCHVHFHCGKMIGGGITFIDDKSRGLHEGYLVTPITKTELILGLIFSGAIKGLMAGTTITIIGGLIAGIDRLWQIRCGCFF